MIIEELDGFTVSQRDDVRIVTIDRPEKRNALDLPMRRLLGDVLERAEADAGVRAVVLTGAGGTFCAGGDVSAMKRSPAADARPRVDSMQRIVRFVAGGRIPYVAAVEGAAFGAGMALGLACDRVVAASDAKFGAAFTGIGLAADAGALWSLPRRVGPARARQLLMLGGVIDADEALRIGAADALAEPGGALDAAIADARRFAAGPPRALAALKQALANPPGDLVATLDAEADMQLRLIDSDDYEEGIKAFLEKRKPNFPGT